MKIKWKIFEITFAKEKLKHLKYVTTSDREITETVRDLRKKVSHFHGPDFGRSVRRMGQTKMLTGIFRNV